MLVSDLDPLFDLLFPAFPLDLRLKRKGVRVLGIEIQDALDLDPEDTDALSLKSQIERERREKKIEEWIQIAHQHLDNQAFSQAREALNNVLKLKPNDTVALALVAEVARREREV